LKLQHVDHTKIVEKKSASLKADFFSRAFQQFILTFTIREDDFVI